MTMTMRIMRMMRSMYGTLLKAQIFIVVNSRVVCGPQKGWGKGARYRNAILAYTHMRARTKAKDLEKRLM